MTIEVRDAGDEDVESLARIYGDHVLTGTASFELEPPSAAEMRDRLHAALDRQLPYLVAVQDGDVAGFAYASVYRARPAYRYTVEDSVYVANDRSGLGIGTALLTDVVARCGELGYRQMIAVIGDSANEASVRLHSRAGFVHVGTLASVGWKFGRWIDTVFMQRRLGPTTPVPPT